MDEQQKVELEAISIALEELCDELDRYTNEPVKPQMHWALELFAIVMLSFGWYIMCAAAFMACASASARF